MIIQTSKIALTVGMFVLTMMGGDKAATNYFQNKNSSQLAMGTSSVQVTTPSQNSISVTPPNGSQISGQITIVTPHKTISKTIGKPSNTPPATTPANGNLPNQAEVTNVPPVEILPSQANPPVPTGQINFHYVLYCPPSTITLEPPSSNTGPFNQVATITNNCMGYDLSNTPITIVAYTPDGSNIVKTIQGNTLTDSSMTLPVGDYLIDIFFTQPASPSGQTTVHLHDLATHQELPAHVAVGNAQVKTLTYY